MGTRIMLCWPCLRNKIKTTRNFTLSATFTVFVKSTIPQTQCCLGCLKYFKPHIAAENMTPWLMSYFHWKQGCVRARARVCLCVCVCVCMLLHCWQTRKHVTYHGCGCFLDLFVHEHLGLVADQLWIRGLVPITCQSQDLTYNKCEQDLIVKSAVWTEPVGRKGWAGTLGRTPCPLTKVHFYYKSGTEWV